MRGSAFEQFARRIASAGASKVPTFLLVRELDVFEVEFSALEFVEEAVLPLLDWSVLSLTRALGAASPLEVDAYLGLGEHVSKDLVLRLVDEKLLEFDSVPHPRQHSPNSADPTASVEAAGDLETVSPQETREGTGQQSPARGIVGFLRRLLGKKETAIPPSAPPIVRVWSEEDARQTEATDVPEEGSDFPRVHVDARLADPRSRFQFELARARTRASGSDESEVGAAQQPDNGPSTLDHGEPRMDRPSRPSSRGRERSANALHESRADSEPTCRLTAAGLAALEREKTIRRRHRPMRLTFSVEPLQFLSTVDEKRMRHSQHRRGKLLAADQVPPILRRIDEVLALEDDVRGPACGIAASIPGSRGNFVGVVPGEQWEVRPVRDRSEAAPLLIVAGFPTEHEEGLEFKTYTRFHDEIVERPHLDSRFLLDVRTKRGLLAASGLDAEDAELLEDGAFLIKSSAADLPGLLGEADEARDVYVESATIRGWTMATRVHAIPADLSAAHAGFFEYLTRRDADLRRDFDRTCAAVSAMLLKYWGSDHALPSAEDAARALWMRTDMRSALCMRRLHSDLVNPYIKAIP